MNLLDRYLKDQIDVLRSTGVFRRLRILEGPQGAKVHVDGRDVINLSSNNYLGLATHPCLVSAAIDAARTYGTGTGAVRSIVGTFDIQEELEHKLARFKGTEAALVFQSGFAANQAVLGSILEEGDLIISDVLSHASIVDGIRLTKATRAVYAHSDMGDLERALHRARGKYRKVVIATDGVFPMGGDIAPLDKIAELAAEYGAATIVDDAHAIGVLGHRGRGTASHFNIPADGWDITVGTLSKAVGGVGGFVAGSQRLRQVMEHRARPFLFSTSHPPAVTAAASAAIDILSSLEGEVLIDRLWANTQFFQTGLRSFGFDIAASQTPITPVIIGDEVRALRFSEALFEQGLLAAAIVYPTVPRGKARVRTIVTADHTTLDLQEALDIFQRVGRSCGVPLELANVQPSHV